MPNRFMLLACLGVLIAPAARAQLHLGDFDVSDGKIENAAGGHLMVSTKEMRATLKFPTQQEVTIKLTYLGPTKEVSHLGNREVRSHFGIKLRAQECATSYMSCGIWLPTRR